MNDVVTKPFMREDLRDSLNQWHIINGPNRNENSLLTKVRELIEVPTLVEKVLNEYKSYVSEAPDDIYGMTISAIQSYIEKISVYSDSSDKGDLAIAAHSLKSSCGFIGAMKLSDIAEKLEVQVETDEPSIVSPLVEALVDEYERVIICLDKAA